MDEKRWIYDDQITEIREEGTSRFTPTLFIIILLALTVLGLVMLYSASYDEALSFGLPHYYFAQRQAQFALLALIPMLLIILLPLSVLRRMSYPFLLVTTALLLLTLFSPFGQEKLGSRRWLEIGGLPSLQPSEFAKIAIILFYAAYFSARTENQGRHFIVAALVGLFFTALILAQRDYSSALLFLLLCLLMLLAGGMRLSILIALIGFIVPPAIVALFSQGYRVRRIVSFLIPSLDPSGINYQVTISLRAIKRGGLFGVGLGEGLYKQGLLPEVQSDFIFSSIAEEIGLVGVALIILLFAALLLITFTTASRVYESDRFLSLATFGIGSMIAIQTLLNLAVVTALLPPTGIPLPFFSQGGTNLFVILSGSAITVKALWTLHQRGGAS
jgi:cell division protein FtsW